MKWVGDTSKVEVNRKDQDMQKFQSRYSKMNLRNSRFTGLQFHFHSGSEHTVSGKRYDLEMHTVHIPDEAGLASYAAMGIIFDTTSYNKDVTEK